MFPEMLVKKIVIQDRLTGVMFTLPVMAIVALTELLNLVILVAAVPVAHPHPLLPIAEVVTILVPEDTL